MNTQINTGAPFDSTIIKISYQKKIKRVGVACTSALGSYTAIIALEDASVMLRSEKFITGESKQMIANWLTSLDFSLLFSDTE